MSFNPDAVESALAALENDLQSAQQRANPHLPAQQGGGDYQFAQQGPQRQGTPFQTSTGLQTAQGPFAAGGYAALGQVPGSGGAALKKAIKWGILAAIIAAGVLYATGKIQKKAKPLDKDMATLGPIIGAAVIAAVIAGAAEKLRPGTV